ncbi:hypothetical protein [Clostridium sp. UBA1652]|uniref:hypothetical protein n=1 Tax=Clostridium sp. UBA1652 TaxID=1946348 RepID=UPI00257EFD83|nr:hypothetical protein [Clostridium sp. UBA1652]
MKKDKSIITNKNKIYLPNDRDFYEPDEHDLKSYSPNGEYTILPDPTKDPIVSNNISWMEFDYTDQSLYKED